MKNYPALFYEKEKDDPVALVGYTLALGLMAAGVAETLVHFTQEGKAATPLGGWLGPLLITTGGAAAYGYLREADIVY
jgi:hypothetical protein